MSDPADRDKLALGLSTLMAEDPTIFVKADRAVTSSSS